MNRIQHWLILAVIGLGFITGTAAQTPAILNYQGYLTDADGQASDDPVVVEFSIYTVESGGTPIWSEFQNVFPTQGLFSTTFGHAGNPFPVGMFDTPLFLGVKVSVDEEMVPRTPIASAAFAQKAQDAFTLDGRVAADLDQSADIDTLNSTLTQVQGTVATVQTQVNTAEAGILGNTQSLTTLSADVTTLANEVNLAQSDLNQLQTDVNVAESNISALQSDLTDKQNRVTGTCPQGSSIRAIGATGGVTCEIDDDGPWSFDGDIYSLNDRIGIGTSSPTAWLFVEGTNNVDPLRVRVNTTTRLQVHAENGSVSVGSNLSGPDNGLYVAGSTGIGAISDNIKLVTQDSNWQFGLANNTTGGGIWYMGASADSWAAGGGRFVINNTNTSSSAAMVIDADKEMGIGTTNPLTKLHIVGGDDVSTINTGGFLTLGNTTSANIAMDSNEIMARSNGNSATLALNAEGGTVTVNANGSQNHDSLEVRGRLLVDNGGNSGMRFTATSSNPTNAILEPTLSEEALVGGSVRPFWRMYSREFYANSALEYRTYSDRSLKSNITPVKNAVATIRALEGVTYKLERNPILDSPRALSAEEQFVMDNQVGFIAQDVAEVLPQLVTQDKESGLQTVAYLGVVPVLVEAIKEQQAQIEAQQQQIDQLLQRLGE